MILIGLTGSIGMGKSTTAGFFREAGVPVNDADEVVHRLYSGRAAPLIEAAFPGTVEDGVVDRQRLAARVLGDDAALRRLEAIVHPLVREEEVAFVEENRAKGTQMVVLDIPLLFEKHGEERVDVVVVVTASAEIQRARVLARPGMTPEKFEAILARQTPDAEKRRHADHVIDTGLGLDHARAEVARIIAEIQRG